MAEAQIRIMADGTVEMTFPFGYDPTTKSTTFKGDVAGLKRFLELPELKQFVEEEDYRLLVKSVEDGIKLYEEEKGRT